MIFDTEKTTEIIDLLDKKAEENSFLCAKSIEIAIELEKNKSDIIKIEAEK